MIMSRTILAVLLMLMAVPLAGAQGGVVELHLNFKNIDTNTPLADLPIIISATNLNTGEELTTVEYLNEDAELILDLTPGNWEMEFTIQNPDNKVTMYYLKRALNLQSERMVQERTFYMIPTGSISGAVYNSEGERVSDGDLEFDCTERGVSIDYPDDISQFGTFEAPIATTGECSIFASVRGEIGVGTVTVARGNVSEVEITLREPLASTSNFLLIAGGVVLLTIFGLVLFFKMKERWKEEVLEEVRDEREEEPEEEELNPRARDVMKTLRQREREVVEFLLGQEGLEATQGQTRNGTGIPKTTLARVFKALEDKKVVEVEKIGNMKRVSITDWFLGKED